MAFINWGEESQEQKNLRAFFEQQAMYEQAVNMRLQAQSQAQGGAAGSGGVSAPTVDGGTGSITFNGTNQYVSSPNAQVATWLPGTGDFTIEWFMKKGVGGSGAPRVFSLGYDTSAAIGCSIEGGTCYIWPYGQSLKGQMPANYNNGSAWTHIAICRASATTRLFINGTKVMQANSDTRSLTNEPLAANTAYGFNLNMGVDNPAAVSPPPNWWAGSITNFRWTNSAVYVGETLDVPTAPLTILPATKLLMLGGSLENPVVDATGVNTLTNVNTGWSENTPFL